MVDKNRNNDLYSMWYNISDEIGKQLFDISNMGDLNYSVLQKSWKGYSENVSKQFSKLMRIDDNYYKDLINLWNEFTDTMSSQISNLKVYEKPEYNKWYESWLDYTDRASKDLTQAIQKQLKAGTELFDMNELWQNNLGMNEDQKQEMFKVTKIMGDYWLEMMGTTTELFKDSLTSKSASDFPQKLPEFYQQWSKSYSNLIENLIKTSSFEIFKGNKYDQNLSGLRAIQHFFANNLKNFGLVDNSSGNGYDELYSELQGLKKDVDGLTKELDAYKVNSTSRKKK
jgi:hypothetical protein